MSLGLMFVFSLLGATADTPGEAYKQYASAVYQEEWQTSWDMLSRNSQGYIYDKYLLEKSASKKSDEALKEWQEKGITDLPSYWVHFLTSDKNWKKSYANKEIIKEEVIGNEATVKYKDYNHKGTIYMVKEIGVWKLDLAH